MAFLSFMMVSNVRLPKAKVFGNKMAKIGMSLIVASVYLCGLTLDSPEYLLGVVATFILGGVIYGKMRLLPLPHCLKTQTMRQTPIPQAQPESESLEEVP